MSWQLKQSTAATLAIGPFVGISDGVTPDTSLTAGTVDEIGVYKHDGTALTDLSGTTTFTSRAGGMYTMTLATGDTATLGRLKVFVRDDTKVLPVWLDCMVLSANVYDSLVGGGDVLDVSVTEWTGTTVGAVDAAGYPVVTIKNGTGAGEIATTAGVIDTVAVNSDMVGTTSAMLASSLPAGGISDADKMQAYFQLCMRSDAAITTDRTTELGEINANEGTGAGDYAATADSLEAADAARVTLQSDTDDIQTRLPTVLVGGAMDCDVSAMQAGVVTAAAIATAAIDADAIAADAIGASELATDAVNEIRDAILSDSTPFAGANIDATISSRVGELLSGTATAGSTTTCIDTSNLTQVETDHWKGCWIEFTSGNLDGQVRLITGFTPAADQLTFAPATVQAVVAQSFRILPANRVDLGQWLGVTPNALISGAVDADVSVMQAGVIVAATFATDAVDANALAADAAQEIRNSVTGGVYPLDTDGSGRIRIVDGTGAGEINTNAGAIAVVDLVTTTTTNTDVTALQDISTSDVLTQVNAALDTAITELTAPSQPAATPSLRSGLMLLYMAFRNDHITQTSGTDALEVYNSAGSIVCHGLITDTTGDLTIAKLVSG